MTVTLSGDGTSVTLHNMEDDQLVYEAGLVQTSMFARDTDENFLIPLSASNEDHPSWKVNGRKVANVGGYSNNPERALAEWCAAFESFADGNQNGYTLTSTQRGRSTPGMLRNVRWERQEGNPYTVECSLEFVRGRDFHISRGGSSGPESVNPSSTATLAGQDLGVIQSNRVRREQDLTTIKIPQVLSEVGIDTGLDNNLIISTGGPVRTVSLEGTRWGSPSELDSFERAIESRLGNTLESVTYSEAFPGRSMQVAVEKFDCSRIGGSPRRADYSLTMIEGMQIGDLLDEFDYDFSDAIPDFGSD